MPVEWLELLSLRSRWSIGNIHGDGGMATAPRHPSDADHSESVVLWFVCMSHLQGVVKKGRPLGRGFLQLQGKTLKGRTESSSCDCGSLNSKAAGSFFSGRGGFYVPTHGTGVSGSPPNPRAGVLLLRVFASSHRSRICSSPHNPSDAPRFRPCHPPGMEVNPSSITSFTTNAHSILPTNTREHS